MTTDNDHQRKASPATPLQATDARQPRPAGYQEQPNAHKELEQAITSVPLKNYSDYEITIETKANYADALFSDEDALNQALSEGAEQPEQTAAQPTEQPSATIETIECKQPEETVIDFSVFLTANSKANAFSLSSSLGEQAPTSTVATTGLNGSPVSDHIDFEDNGQTEELFTIKPLSTKVEPTKPEPGIAEPKTLAEKIKQKAKAQLGKSRAQFDEYTGRSLPERTLPLEFNFPPLKSKKEFSSIVSGYEIRKLFEAKGKSSNTIFKQADSDLAKLVKCQLSNANRLSLLDAYSEPLFAKTREVTAMFERKPSAPDDAKRLQLAELALNTLKYLISGYKQVYASFYEAANVLYGPQRDHANRVVFRLIDLLMLEQRLTTALQSPLPNGSIKTFNTLFCALSLYEPQLISQPQEPLSLGERSSIKAMYLQYQVGLAFDFMRISASLHKALNPYIYQNLGLLKLLPFEQTPFEQATGQTIEAITDVWVTSHDSNSAPQYIPASEMKAKKPGCRQFPAIVIEVNRFFNAIKKDYAECIELLAGCDKKHSSKILGAIKPPYAATIMSELNRSVALIENKGRLASYSSYQPMHCKAYSGLQSCIGYFDYHYALNTKKPTKKGEPVNDLPPKPLSAKGEWLCAMRDENVLYLQTDEGKTSVPIDIGHLLLFVITLATEDSESEQPEQQTLLTQVVRMERGQQGKLNLIVELISTQITHATITTASADSAEVLLATKGDCQLLITDYKQPCYKENTIALSLPDLSKSVIAIGNIMTITQKLQCLTLQ